jgi:hypothetical protein
MNVGVGIAKGKLNFQKKVLEWDCPPEDTAFVQVSIIASSVGPNL